MLPVESVAVEVEALDVAALAVPFDAIDAPFDARHAVILRAAAEVAGEAARVEMIGVGELRQGRTRIGGRGREPARAGGDGG